MIILQNNEEDEITIRFDSDIAFVNDISSKRAYYKITLPVITCSDKKAIETIQSEVNNYVQSLSEKLLRELEREKNENKKCKSEVEYFTI